MLKKCVSILLLITFTTMLPLGDFLYVYCLAGQDVTRIALLPIHQLNEEAKQGGLGVNVTNMLTAEFRNRNVFQVVDQNQLLQLVDELQLQASPTVDPRAAQQIGRRLGAQLYIYGSVAKLGEVIGIDYQLVETGKGEVLYADRLTTQSGITLQTLVASIVAQIENIYFGQVMREVTFSSNPSGADVYIDDVERGTTPLTIKLNKGSHNIVLGKSGYRAWVQTINVGEGENSYTITLTPTTAVVTERAEKSRSWRKKMNRLPRPQKHPDRRPGPAKKAAKRVYIY